MIKEGNPTPATAHVAEKDRRFRERRTANAPVAKIRVPENRLRELRDFEDLAASMDRIGLLAPITITESGRLVSGRHRLEAAKALGWQTIPAFVVEDDELENRLVEIDENLIRKELVVWERAKHAAERERVLEALGLRRGAGRHPNPATVAGLARTTAQLAKEAGVGERTLRRDVKIGRELAPGTLTAAVLDHADVSEEKQRNLLNSTTQLDALADISRKHGDATAARTAERALTTEGGNVSDAWREEKRERLRERREKKAAGMRDAAALGALQRYPVLLADPPWRYTALLSPSRRIENHYPTMELEEIKAMGEDLPAADDAALFLWSTSPQLPAALEVMAAWGFDYKSCMVWVKERIGMGHYARQRHELLLIGMRGDMGVPEEANRPDSVVSVRRGEHSAKPEEFYGVIDRMYPGLPKLELFCRGRLEREGWDTWGSEAVRMEPG